MYLLTDSTAVWVSQQDVIMTADVINYPLEFVSKNFN